MEWLIDRQRSTNLILSDLKFGQGIQMRCKSGATTEKLFRIEHVALAHLCQIVSFLCS